MHFQLNIKAALDIGNQMKYKNNLTAAAACVSVVNIDKSSAIIAFGTLTDKMLHTLLIMKMMRESQAKAVLSF